MGRRGLLARHRIVRGAVGKDLLQFAAPAIVVFTAGLVVSALDGWDRINQMVRDMLGEPQELRMFTVQNILGLGLMVIGYAVAFVATITLRRSYSSTLVIKADHQLITGGIYRFVRHPIYLGVILVCFGIPTSVSSVYGLLVMSAMIPIFINRIRIEEELLIAEFGETYLAYKKTTRKLVPFIY